MNRENGLVSNRTRWADNLTMLIFYLWHDAVSQLLEAGSDPRLTNNDGFKPVDILTAGEQNEKVRRLLRDAEAISGFNKADVVGKCREHCKKKFVIAAYTSYFHATNQMRTRNQTEDHHQMKINRHTFGLIEVDQMSEIALGIIVCK